VIHLAELSLYCAVRGMSLRVRCSAVLLDKLPPLCCFVSAHRWLVLGGALLMALVSTLHGLLSCCLQAVALLIERSGCDVRTAIQHPAAIGPAAVQATASISRSSSRWSGAAACSLVPRCASLLLLCLPVVPWA